MSTSRSSRIEQLFKSLRKHYKTVPTAPERSVIDHLVYAAIVEETTYEQADEAFTKLLQSYVDYNEIRVTTAVELAEQIGAGTVSISCAQRLKRILQSIYETRYSFDVEDLAKGNLAKSVELLSGLKGMTPFVCSFVSQNALGGHSIPIGTAELNVSVVVGLLTDAEAKKGSIPGLERAIPKSKGIEFSQLLHQLAVDFANSHKNSNVVAIFKELKVTYKPAPPPPPVVQPVAPEKQETIQEATPAKTNKAAAGKEVPMKEPKAPAAKSKDAKVAKETKPSKDVAKEVKPAAEDKTAKWQRQIRL